MNVTVIGAGIGGLSAACLLANKGHNVTIYEKNESPGGKMNIVKAGAFRFDTGPSLLTMPFVLKRLFKACGHNVSDFIELVPLSPLCRYFYDDGTVFNNYSDEKLTKKELESIAPQDVKAYEKFLKYSGKLYKKTSDAFIFNPLYNLRDLGRLDLLDFFGIDAFTTVSKRVDSYFESPYLRKFFKRFATYNGSSPFRAPATLNVIPHVEINQGGYYVKGGLYKVTEALTDLAGITGVRIQFDSAVEKIVTKGAKATGLELRSGEIVETDLVVANSDVSETLLGLVNQDLLSAKRKQKIKALEPSCSGFVLLLGIDKKYEQLAHHNIFFSDDYEKEFSQIFEEKVMPDAPTIYIANTSHSDPGHAPDTGSNLFILVNAPYLSDSYHWSKSEQEYGDKVIRELEKRGLSGLSEHIQFRESITPADFYKKYLSNKGSIYGTSSNSTFSAFLRPRNKSREIERLYFVGGSTHPGGGIPLVIQSAFNALELIDRFE